MSDGTYWEGGDALHTTGVIAGLKSLGADVNYSLADFIKALEATATASGVVMQADIRKRPVIMAFIHPPYHRPYFFIRYLLIIGLAISLMGGASPE